MSIPSYRSVEPLYIIILHNNTQAESQFRAWIRNNKIDHAVVNGHKLMLHHQQALDRFMVTWRNNHNSIWILFKTHSVHFKISKKKDIGAQIFSIKKARIFSYTILNWPRYPE